MSEVIVAFLVALLYPSLVVAEERCRTEDDIVLVNSMNYLIKIETQKIENIESIFLSQTSNLETTVRSISSSEVVPYTNRRNDAG